jgi:hypothetical protein
MQPSRGFDLITSPTKKNATSRVIVLGSVATGSIAARDEVA